MFENFPKRKKSSFDEPIDRVLAHMKDTDLDTEEYNTLLAHLDKLNRLRVNEKPNKVNADTMAVVVGNLLGILIIVGFERNNIITSKGLGFILRTKHQ